MTTQTITTPGAGTFTVPGGVTSLTIEAWGAGGSGSGSSSFAEGGGGGGYSFAVISVTPGQTVFYNVGAGPTGSFLAGSPGGTSWVNPAANSQPSSNGVVAAGGSGGDFITNPPNPGGAGSIGTVNFTGGAGVHDSGAGAGGGGGAGSGGNGGDGGSAGSGPSPGAGGIPDGGTGGAGAASGDASDGVQPGGGGGGSDSGGKGGKGGDGQVRFTFIASFNVGTPTNLTSVPAKAFTRKHYFNEMEKIRGEALAAQEALDGLDEKGRADRDYESAKAESDEYENNLSVRNYAKAADAKERLEKARKARDHHYFMDVVRKAWADHEAQKKK